LRPRKLSGKLLTRKLLTRKLGFRELRPRELRPRAERPGGRLLRKRAAAWTSVARLRCAGLTQARLVANGEPSPVLAAAVLPAALLPIALRRAALRPAAGKLARVLRPGLLSPVRPGGRAVRARTLHPRAVGRHALSAGSISVGATVTRSGPRSGLPGETGPAAESAGRRPRHGPASRARTTAHAIVTRTPAEPRTPIPRALARCETGILSWSGAPAGPGVGISPAFIVRPVFGVRPPTPPPSPREPCHIIDRKHLGDH
jgi:hypothetical protein